MTQLDVIRMIGDVLTEIDVAVGSLLPSDPDMVRLQDLRRLLDARQLALSRAAFDDNTKRFRDAAAQLKRVNDEIRDSIADIDHMATVLANVTRFLDSVTSFMSTIGALV